MSGKGWGGGGGDGAQKDGMKGIGGMGIVGNNLKPRYNNIDLVYNIYIIIQ
jgi:hypothetical protein